MDLDNLGIERSGQLSQALCHQIEALLLTFGLDDCLFGFVISDSKMQLLAGNVDGGKDKVADYLESMVENIREHQRRNDPRRN